MKQVTVNKADLLTILRANRATHRATFEKALEKYRERMIDYLDTMLGEVQAGKQVDHYIRLPVPEDHTGDYDTAIEMLEMEVGAEVTITGMEFRNLVKDEWEWSRNFASNTTSYLAS